MDTIPYVRLFGSPEVEFAGDVIPLSAKEAAVFAVLLHSPGRQRNRAEVARLIWPIVGIASARRSLSQTIYMLRKKLDPRAVAAVRPESIALGDIATDTLEFRASLDDSDWRGALSLYRGAFLEGVIIPGGVEFDHWADGPRSEYAELAQKAAIELRIDEELFEDQRSDGGDESIADRRPFVGRTDPLRWLMDQLAATRQYGFRAVVLEGEAGIGKTSLAERFARKAVLAGATVALAHGFHAERNVPFGLAVQWLRNLGPRCLSKTPSSWLAVLREAFPGALGGTLMEPGPPGDIAGEYKILEALRQVVFSVSNEAPVLLVLDDLHVADPASLSFLHYLKRQSPSSPIMFLATHRTPYPSGQGPLFEWRDVARMTVPGFTSEEICALARSLLPDTPKLTQEEVDSLAERSGRNPLLLASLLAYRGDAGSGSVPRDAMEWFLGRFEGLSRESQLFLAAFSFVDDGELAEQIAGIPTSAVSVIELELHDAGLIETNPSRGLRPRHGIVPEIALNRLRPPDHRALHNRAARLMADSDRVSPAVVAVQHDIAGNQPGAYLAALTAADASAQLFAAREEEYFLKLALSNAPTNVDASRIRLRLAELFRRVGKPLMALEVIDDRVLLASPLELRHKAQAMRLRIRLETRMGDRLVDQAEVEIAELEPLVEPETAVDMLVAFAAAATDLTAGGAGVRAARRALKIIEAQPINANLARAGIGAASMIGLHEDLAEGLQEVKARESLSPTPAHRVEFLASYATLLTRAGKLIEAEELFVEAIGLAERCAVFSRMFTIRNNLGVCYLDMGRYDDAESELCEAVRICEDFSAADLGDISLDNLVLVEYERGNLKHAMDTGMDVLSAGSVSTRGMFCRHGIIGLVALELGQLSRAFEARREVELLLNRHEYWGGDFSYVEVFLARLLAIEGKQLEARRRLETAIDMYRRRDLLARARLELELARLDLRSDPRAAAARASAMLELLRDTGARPLIERFQDVADSASVRALR